MTISKEERAELRDLIHEVSKGDHNFPVWDYDDSSPVEHPEIIEHSAVDGVQHIGNLPSKWHTRFACAAVNAAPKLLASLDAADERIAGLEAENRRTLGLVDNGLAQIADWQNLLYRADERASAEANAHAEEVAELKRRIAELVAAAQWRPMSDAPKDGTWILAFTDPSSMLFKVPAIVVRWRAKASYWDDGQGGHYSNLVAWLPIPALPEGGV